VNDPLGTHASGVLDLVRHQHARGVRTT